MADAGGEADIQTESNASSITPRSLERALRDRIQASRVEVVDVSGGCGQAFTATIVSPAFSGKSSLARHRLVNAALKAEIAAVHAWSAKCLTEEEWAKNNPS